MLVNNAFQEIHAPAKPGEQRTSSLDATRAKKELAWQPEVSLEDGLKQTFEWFKK